MFSVEISEDGLQATGTFRPATGQGRPIDSDHVEEVLFRAGVSVQIDWFTIHTSIDRCEREHTVIADVPVAAGRAPEPYIPERLVVEKRFRRRHPVAGAVDHDTGAMDLRERHLFIIVHEGDTVAQRVPIREGSEGLNVYGEAIPVPSPQVPQPAIGDNLKEEDGKVIALVGGQLEFTDELIEVHDTLILNEGVGYHTGHIRFPGDCELSGTVRRGFKLWLGGQLHAKDTVDVTEVLCGRSLVCDGGLMGHNEGVVRSKLTVRARFVEACTVESHGAIYIQQSCLYGYLRTLDRAVFGDRSKVVGSEITAANGVFAHSLGSPRGARVTVWVGINFVVERKIEGLRKKVERLVERSMHLQMKLDQHSSERLLRRKQEIADHRNELQEKIGNLLVSLDSNEQAMVAVKDKVYAGTLIYICRSFYQVEEDMKGVQFRLDTAAGKIIAEKLDPAGFPRVKELETND